MDWKRRLSKAESACAALSDIFTELANSAPQADLRWMHNVATNLLKYADRCEVERANLGLQAQAGAENVSKPAKVSAEHQASKAPTPKKSAGDALDKIGRIFALFADTPGRLAFQALPRVQQHYAALIWREYYTAETIAAKLGIKAKSAYNTLTRLCTDNIGFVKAKSHGRVRFAYFGEKVAQGVT